MMGSQFFCDGSPVGPGGAYQGHMLPGVLFVIWATHWLQGSMRHWFACQRAGVPYQSQPYYSLPGLPNFPFESLIKFIMAGVGALLELTWHDDGFQSLLCGPDTPRAGHFNGDHINNWQHVTMYMCFSVSGVVDLAGWFGALPPGTEKAFLSLAFAGEAILMGLHEKDEPLDRFTHQALAVAMLVCCFMCAAEAAWPHAYLATCGRVCGVMMQGIVFIFIAQIRFADHISPAWDTTKQDLAPFQYSKVIVTQAIATLVSCYAGLHIAIHVLEQKNAVKPMQYQYSDVPQAS